MGFSSAMHVTVVCRQGNYHVRYHSAIPLTDRQTGPHQEHLYTYHTGTVSYASLASLTSRTISYYSLAATYYVSSIILAAQSQWRFVWIPLFSGIHAHTQTVSCRNYTKRSVESISARSAKHESAIIIFIHKIHGRQ